MKTDIFQLQIIPIADILVHEQFDESRAYPLVEKLKLDGFQANPIIVAALDGGKYLQLDGMNRLSSFKLLKLKSILAQIIDYNDQENVELSSWTHLFFQNDIEKFIKKITTIKTVIIKKGNIDNVGHRYIKEYGTSRLCTLIDKKREVYLVTTANISLWGKIDILNSIVDLYKEQIIRDILPQKVTNSDLETLFEEHNSCNLILVFPTFTRHQIIDIVRLGGLFPPGVTRHLIQRRCLNVNAPLKLFAGGLTGEESNKRLEDLLNNRHFRIYEEITVYFE